MESVLIWFKFDIGREGFSTITQKGRNNISPFTLSTLAVAAPLCSFSSAVLADEMPADKMMMLTADGKTSMVSMPDEAMMADI